MTYDNTNSGAAFNTPAYTGKLNLGGEDYQLVIIKAHKDAKISHNIIVYNRHTCVQSALFNNDKKETDSHPNFKGSISVNGDYWLSVWVNTKNDKVYLSVKANPKDEQQNYSEPARDINDDLDGESIPF